MKELKIKKYEEIAIEKFNILCKNKVNLKLKVLNNESYLCFLNHNAIVRRFSNYCLNVKTSS